MSSIQPQVVLDRYELFEVIGRGGMASVHLARQLGGVGFSRVVAVKRLHPQFATAAEFVAMFLDEARLASHVRHPNVVSTLDVVEAGAEILMVMEYVEGASLTQLLKIAKQRGERIPLPVLSAIACGTLRGLHAAHEARSPSGERLDIIHRDVSPQNVMVGTDGVPRVLDFGVAKAEGQLHDTRTGEIRGKIAYMAPEHLRDKASRASDIYAMGVVLWEALSGEPLFKATTHAATVTKILDGNVPLLSSRVSGLPGELEAFVSCALAMDPASRFASADAMAIELERVVQPAKPQEVAGYVELLAEDALRELRRLATAIGSRPATGPERLSRGASAARPDAVPGRQAATNEPAPPRRYLDNLPSLRGAARTSTADETSTLTGTLDPGPHTVTRTLPEAPAAPSPGPRGSSSGRAKVGSIVLIAAALTGLVLLSWRFTPSRNAATNATETTPTGASAAPTAAAEVVADPSGAAASAPIDAVPSAVASVDAVERPRIAPSASSGPSSSTPSRAARGGQPTVLAPASAGAAPPKADDCNIPYEVDQNGVQRVKTRCFKVTP